MNYWFKYRRRLFWRRHLVKGHDYLPELDRVVLYAPGSGLIEIAKWSQCDLKLGPDWALAKQKAMEAKAGQAIPVNNGNQ